MMPTRRKTEPATPGGVLPVILPLSPALNPARTEGNAIRFFRGRRGIIVSVLVLLAFGIPAAHAQAAPGPLSIIATIWKWTPLIASGFLLNIIISFLAMAIGTVLGTPLGLAQISPQRPVRSVSWFVTQFFRNAPWLVLLFYAMLLLPFNMQIGGISIALPDWLKATFGLSLPVMANMSELVRGAVQSIPHGQWESAESLAFTRRQTLWMIILPQCIKRMLPPWMNLYANLNDATPLCSIVGVNESMTLTNDALAAEANHALLVPMYLYLLAWFFIYCYPIARWTVALERRFAVKG
jgi:polar amino acid transport system permease protein